MRGENYTLFKNCLLSCVKNGVKHTQLFEDVQLDVVDDEHPLSDMIADVHHESPIIIISQHVAQSSTPAKQKPVKDESSFQSDTAQDADESTHDSTQESLMGSPLKLQEFTHPSPAVSRVVLDSISTPLRQETSPTRKFNYFPLSTDTARYIVNLYNVVVRELLASGAETCMLPIWVLCDGGSVEHLAWMSSHVTYSSKTEMASINIHTITSEEGVCRKELPEVSSVLQEHYWTTDSQKVDSITCLAEYDVFGRRVTSELSELLVRLSWKELKAMLQAPPANATAIIDVKISPSLESANTKAIYAELLTLKGILQGIEGNAISWSAENTEKPLLQRVSEFLEELKLGDAIKQKQEEDDDEQESDKLLTTRYDMDFTENLWDILKDCSSYRNLLECLELVLGALQHGEIQPMVHQSNSCKLAKMVRDSYYNKMVVDKLIGIESLELLAEIGAEKLLRDYMTALVGKDLVAEGNLDYYTKVGDIQQRFKRIEKLHYVLELVNILKQFVHLPKINISFAARHALKYYESHGVDEEHTFSIPVPTNTVNECIAQCLPYKWQATLCSKVGGRNIHSVYLLSTKPVFSYLQSQALDTSKVIKGDEEEHYHLVSVKQTVDEI